ncbi:Aegerolysin family protein [Kalaharituber pfeilii]|nr:Aegerolysin family protein [Kalaharituber pfeilii]
MSLPSANDQREIVPNAYAQWAVIHVINKCKRDSIVIKDVTLRWGKFHEPGNKDAEIKAGSIENTVVDPGKEYWIYTCGRKDAASGTEGYFRLYVNNSKTKICSFDWDCPWGSKTNSYRVSEGGDDYPTTATGGNLDSGALGDVYVTVYKSA